MTGRYYEDFEVGSTIEHDLGRTITEADNVLFCSLTMNDQPLHLDHEAARASPFKRPIVNGILTLAIATGISVRDTTAGTLVANLGYEEVRHPAPVFHGDTIHVATEVVEKRGSNSRPEAGIVTLKHVVTNQDDTVVCEYKRVVMVRRRDAPEGGE